MWSQLKKSFRSKLRALDVGDSDRRYTNSSSSSDESESDRDEDDEISSARRSFRHAGSESYEEKEGETIFTPPPPEKIEIDGITGNSAHVRWRPPNVEDVRRAARNFIVQVKLTGKRDVRVAYYGPSWDTTLVDLEPKSLYSVRIAADNPHGLGPFSSYQAFRTRRVQSMINDRTSQVSDDASSDKVPRSPMSFRHGEKSPERKKRRTSSAITKALRLKRFRLLQALRPSVPVGSTRTRVVLDIRRERLVEDSIHQLQSMGELSWQEHEIRVQYEHEEGTGAGVNRDWFIQFSRQFLSARDDVGLFLPACEKASSAAWPSPDDAHAVFVALLRIDPAATSLAHQELWQLVGRFLAKAIRSRVLIEAPLPMSVWNALVEGVFEDDNTIDDKLKRVMYHISNVDGGLYSSFEWMLNNKIDEEDLMQNFEVTLDPPRQPLPSFVSRTRSHDDDTTASTKRRTVELVPGGSKIAVNESNKKEYIVAYGEWLLRTSTAVQIENILIGFSQVMSLAMVRSLLFSPVELRTLANGDPYVDVEVLQRQSICTNGLSAESSVVMWFWEWMWSASVLQRQLLLEFATGSPRSPLDGFDPPFELRGTEDKANALPRAHTCFHQLVLPAYDSKDALFSKVEKAISMASGFQFL